MKLAIKRETFLKGLHIASRAVSQNNTLPILSNILLTCEGNKLYFESTNLEIAIRHAIPVPVTNEGRVTLPAKLIHNYVSLMNDEEIQLHVTEGFTVNITAPASKTTIKGLDPQDFPSIPTVNRNTELTLDAEVFRQSIKEVVFSASDQAARPVLSGVFLKGSGKELTMVATNSYRLSEKKIMLPESIDGEIKTIVPARTLMEIERIIADNEVESITVILSDNQILFKVGGTELISRLIEGMFPAYEQLIPKSCSSTASVDKQLLLQTIKRVHLFARENNNSVIMTLDADSQTLRIQSNATQIGSEVAEIPANISQSNEVPLNCEYLLDILQALPAGMITFGMNERITPTVFTSEKQANYIHIIMPLRG